MTPSSDCTSLLFYLLCIVPSHLRKACTTTPCSPPSPCESLPLPPTLRCSDLTTPVRVGNPEQDCFTRLVHSPPAGVRLIYPFDEQQRDLRAIPLNHSTLDRLGEAPHTEFSCVADPLAGCDPWFIHFQAWLHPSPLPDPRPALHSPLLALLDPSLSSPPFPPLPSPPCLPIHLPSTLRSRLLPALSSLLRRDGVVIEGEDWRENIGEGKG